MFRPLALNHLIFLAALVFLFQACENTASEKETPNFTKRPNVIYILADDLGYGDLSCYGQKKFATPNIDALSKSGMLFTQHYSGSTVCAPSRSALITGEHTGHTFIRGNKEVDPEGQEPIVTANNTLPKQLKKAGYVTGAFGKWGLGFPGSSGDPNQQGFDEFYGYNCQRMGHNYYPWHLWHNQKKELIEANKGSARGAYGPDLIQEKALAFIDQYKDSSFFLFYPSIIPHAELIAPERLMANYRGKYLPERKYVGADEGTENFRIGGYASQSEAHAAFAAMIHLLDEQVGEIRKKVKELGIEENTLIIFTSDNGPHQEGGAGPDYFDSNGPLRGYKRDLYEGGIRVPMIASWPGKIMANSTSDHISAFWDVLPTLCEVAQTKTPSFLDGISFLPTLIGQPQTKQHDYLYWEFHEQGGKQAVLRRPWKAIRLNMHANPNAPIELYNLNKDLNEEEDVAAMLPDMVNFMDSLMKKAHIQSDEFLFDYEVAAMKVDRSAEVKEAMDILKKKGYN